MIKTNLNIGKDNQIRHEGGDNRMFLGARMYCEGREKPYLRGYVHLFGAIIVLPKMIMKLIQHIDTTKEATAVAILGIGYLVCWGSSALFHCFPWELRKEIALQKIDHSAIFITIACNYTPFGIIISEKSDDFVDSVILATIIGTWIFCLAGIWHVHNIREGRLKYWVLMICFTFPSYPFLSSYLTVFERGYVIMGLLVYGIGAIIFSKRLINPIPRWCGYHEIFHLCTLVASIYSFLLLLSLIQDEQERCSILTPRFLPDIFLSILTSTLTTKVDICNP